MREALLCAREGITINIFLLNNWNQSREDVRFAYRMAEATKGRVFFVAGHDLDPYGVWDYLTRREQIVSLTPPPFSPRPPRGRGGGGKEPLTRHKSGTPRPAT